MAPLWQHTKHLGISALFDHRLTLALGGVPKSDILRADLGLLLQGKSDFDAIGEFWGDAFSTRALGVSMIPSCSTLRQRMGRKPDSTVG